MSRAADLAALIVDVNTTEAKTDELTGKTTASSIAVTAEGGSTTTTLQQGLAKAFSNFNGLAGTVAFTDSFNYSSVTDNTTGDFNLSFTNNMGNTAYTPTIACTFFNGIYSGGVLAASIRIFTSNASGTLQDRDDTVTAIHGDLA